MILKSTHSFWRHSYRNTIILSHVLGGHLDIGNTFSIFFHISSIFMDRGRIRVDMGFAGKNNHISQYLTA